VRNKQHDSIDNQFSQTGRYGENSYCEGKVSWFNAFCIHWRLEGRNTTHKHSISPSLISLRPILSPSLPVFSQVIDTTIVANKPKTSTQGPFRIAESNVGDSTGKYAENVVLVLTK